MEIEVCLGRQACELQNSKTQTENLFNYIKATIFR